MIPPPSVSVARMLSILLALPCLGADGPGEKLPAQVKPETIVVSRDGTRYAYIKRTVSSLVPVIDGKAQAPAEWIANNLILFSTDSKHTFYIARGRKDARVVVDGVAGAAFDSVDDWLFTAGGRVMYLAKKKRMAVVVCDGVERAQLSRIRLGALGDVNGAVAFVEMSDAGERVFRDNKGEGMYQRVGDVRFSPDGRRLAYRAQRNGRWMMVVDGVEKAACEEVSGPVFADDSAHLGWLAMREGKTAMVLDEVETPLGLAGELFPPALSAYGRGWVAAVRREGKTEVYRDGKSLGSVGAMVSPVFSADGSRLAFVAIDRAGKSRVVLDGRELEPADYVFDLRFSADSKRFAYVATTGKKDVLWVDGKVAGTFDAVGVRTLAFSADGRTYAAVVKEENGQRIIYEGGMTERFDAVAAGQPLSVDVENQVRVFVVREGRLASFCISLSPQETEPTKH